MNVNRVSNRLINEKSPYLLQHAHNPVDWYPWSKEAFDHAKKEDKPIFLSIGYSSCHWCHVMESESFEDEEVATALNQDFIAIKVDKEERPDIDTVYMNVCQMMTGQGGWPNTIIMTPDQKPFFAGTYFPKKEVLGRVGLLDILPKVIDEWKNRREELLGTAEKIVTILEEASQGSEDSSEIELSEKPIGYAKQYYVEQFDEQHGGFGSSPKFPTPHNLLLLLDQFEKKKDSRSFEMADCTLNQMYRGGIYDHIGGGFSRYSTDRKWLVPHFEKMLYDNALLIMAYTKAFELTQEALYRDIVNDTVAYVLREMQSKEGGFYSAQDADSEGVEGKYYLFRQEEVIDVLGEEAGHEFCSFFDISHDGNFEGANIPNLLKNQDFRIKPKTVQEQKKKLFEYRSNRMKLNKDDKILTSWNGLMIAAITQAYKVFRERPMLEAAEAATTFVIKNLTRKDGGLRVRYRLRESIGIGFLDDYAFFVWGLIELHEATQKVIYLQNALDLNNRMLQDFWDQENGGFFLTSVENEKLIYRPKETYDGAIPSGNSVAAYNLVRLARRMNSPDMEELARRQLQFLNKAMENHPAGHSFGLIALSHFLEK